MKPRAFRIFDKHALHRICGLLAQMLVSEERPILVEVSDYQEQRTSAQNKLLHAIFREVAENVIVEGKHFSSEAWKEFFRRRFIGTEEILLPGGERVERGISTTTLNVGQCAEAIDRFYALLAAEHGYLPEELAA